MGKDKFENEDLIRYGWPEDLWFHVDDLSSAHVYLRLKKGQKLEDVSEDTIMECAQLVKANSIEGCKKNNVWVVYTRWRNLLKTSDMVVGAIGFHDQSRVKRINVVKNNMTVNRITKTKEERHPNLAELQAERQREFIADQKKEKRAQMDTEKRLRLEREEAAKMRSYSSIMDEEKMVSNADIGGSVDVSASRTYEDDFM